MTIIVYDHLANLVYVDRRYTIVPKELTVVLNGAEAFLKDGDTGRVYFLTTGEGVIVIEHLTNFIAPGSRAPVARRHWAKHRDPRAAAVTAAQYAEACGGSVDQF